MKLSAVQATLGSAALLLVEPTLATAAHKHKHLGRRNDHSQLHSRSAVAHLEDRGLACKFPSGDGLIAVSPNAMNGGWALSPDQVCSPGKYCPYACPPGEMMAQWKPMSTYATTDRMAGGLHCGLDGKVSKPFDDKPLCMKGTGNVKVVNKCGKVTSFCQTVLPGMEDMIIPNDIIDEQTIAVPGTDYWDSTAAHYYINEPGVSSKEGCIWGDDSKPMGNWAFYVAGTNTDHTGNTFVKLGMNPIYEASSLAGKKPTFGMEIKCNSGNCQGLPCRVDGSGVTSSDKSNGAGGSAFCVATVPQGGSASIVVFNLDGSSGSDKPKETSSAKPSPTPTPTSTPTPTPTSTKTTPTTTSTTPTSTSTSTTSTTTSTPTTSSTTSTTTSSLASSATFTSSTMATTSSKEKPSASLFALGGIFQENGTATASYTWMPSSVTKPTAVATTGGSAVESAAGAAAPTESAKNESAGPQGSSAIVGLVIAVFAAACIL
ncbi:hypothetical protein PG995_010179 [Apiospora arundinis]|uniref:Beta-glucosidase-domain-containing protein n=1 Tax=Apiospora arundinis TaxID=335852 RepID=A0ABR2IT35_9PEZI